MPYITPRGLKGLKQYKYKPGGYTWLDDLHQPFWNGEVIVSASKHAITSQQRKIYPAYLTGPLCSSTGKRDREFGLQR